LDEILCCCTKRVRGTIEVGNAPTFALSHVLGARVTPLSNLVA
jgi:hypothetical protein